MDIRFDIAGNLCAQIRTGALSSVEILSGFIARIEALDHSTSVIAVSGFEGRRRR
jgi:Asp-tRNA(Asn)/Glu-tRNA(Gln) amidotransferase A subunit family amidase